MFKNAQKLQSHIYGDKEWISNDDLKQMQTSTFTKNEKHVRQLALE
jgi:hypothetical protein